jgi:3-oxoacyl-[acyl-carrier-protein] synthase II
MELKRVVVTGLGALTPIGNSVSEYWNGLINGVSGAAMIKSFDTSKFKTKFACEVKNFNAEAFLGRKEARKLDPFVQYALYSTAEAVADAGLDFSKLDTTRIGVIWGSGIGGLKTFLDEVSALARGDGTPHINPFFIPKMIADIAPGHISIKYGLHGPNFTTVSACASSNNSLIDSFNYIRMGKANMFVSGGSEAIINEAGIGGFNAMHALSTRNDDPATASRPFDLDRDGFVAGEGAGTIILEELEHAKARGAKIYAEMIGGGMSADAYHMTAPHPEGLGAALVMREALRDAGINASEIDYVNVHGTSTPIGDPQEIKAIEAVFGERAYEIAISATKSMTGHLLGAAGAVEAIATIMAINTGIIPPTINHFTDDPAFDPRINFTFNTAQKREVRTAQSNGFGFGGHNASVIFRRFED